MNGINGPFTPRLNITQTSTLTDIQQMLADLLAPYLANQLGRGSDPYTGFHPPETQGLFPYGLPQSMQRTQPQQRRQEPARPQQTAPSRQVGGGTVNRDAWGRIISTTPPPPQGVSLTQWAAYLEGTGSQTQPRGPQEIGGVFY